MADSEIDPAPTSSAPASSAPASSAPAAHVPAGSGSGSPRVEGLQGARARVARALLESGPNTAVGLADMLGLTPAAVRKSLDDMLDLGYIEASERPQFGPDRRSKGRGRPAKWYTLTAVGREGFDNAYDDLAVGALRFLAGSAQGDAVMEFARHRVSELERRYAGLLPADLQPEQRLPILVQALIEDGFVATAKPAAGGVQICQHHCPVAHVAEEFPQFCEAETEAFGRMLGTHVLRLATIAHGDGICTTHVPIAGHPTTAHATAVDVTQLKTAHGSERNTV